MRVRGHVRNDFTLGCWIVFSHFFRFFPVVLAQGVSIGNQAKPVWVTGARHDVRRQWYVRRHVSLGAHRISANGRFGLAGCVADLVGLAIVLCAMDFFRNFSRWLGNDTPGLKVTGLYNLSRNPQFIGYGLLILGVVIAWGKLLGLIGFLSYLMLAYFVALVEEEHLERVYGQSYRDYCARVPRFIGLLKKQNTA